MYAIRSYYVSKEIITHIKNVEKNIKEYKLTVRDAIDMLSVDIGMATPMLSVTEEVVITSYSIHYTKLYDRILNQQKKSLYLMFQN